MVTVVMWQVLHLFVSFVVVHLAEARDRHQWLINLSTFRNFEALLRPRVLPCGLNEPSCLGGCVGSFRS